jgi:tight adherence protein B
MISPLILVAVLVALGVLALVLAAGSYLGGDRSIRGRLTTYLSAGEHVAELPAHVSDAADESAIAGRLNDALSNAGFAERIARELARANVPLTVSEYVLIKVAATLLPVAITLLITRSLLLAPAIALIGFLAPTLWVRQRRRARSRSFEEQLPETLAAITSSLRGGFSLVQSLGNVGREAPEPTGMELRRVVQETQLGLSINNALANMALRMESQDLELVVSVLKIHTRVGGNLTGVLENISTTVRERIRLRREIRVITAQQRYASYVLGLLPVILGVILMGINPDYMLKLFQPGWTLAIPITAVVLNIMGFLFIRKIVDIKI